MQTVQHFQAQHWISKAANGIGILINLKFNGNENRFGHAISPFCVDNTKNSERWHRVGNGMEWNGIEGQADKRSSTDERWRVKHGNVENHDRVDTNGCRYVFK